MQFDLLLFRYISKTIKSEDMEKIDWTQNVVATSLYAL